MRSCVVRGSERERDGGGEEREWGKGGKRGRGKRGEREGERERDGGGEGEEQTDEHRNKTGKGRESGRAVRRREKNSEREDAKPTYEQTDRRSATQPPS